MDQDGVKVVTIGGGTGSFTILTGMKKYINQLSAIVSMVDDGGSTGDLRDEFGVLPPGDVRQCLVALSSSTDVVRELFNYRFEQDKSLGGHSFGNLFISALEKVTGSFSDAVETAGDVLAIQGQVLPATLSDVRLQYEDDAGNVITGEHVIGDTDLLKGVDKPNVTFDQPALINPHARKAILSADFVVLCPGSLYGSLMPALMIDGMLEALNSAKGEIIYVANLTSGSDTDGYYLEDFISELERATGGAFIDTILFNNQMPSSKMLERYRQDSQEPLEIKDRASIKQNLVERELSVAGDDEESIKYFRHDADKVARQLMRLYFS